MLLKTIAFFLIGFQASAGTLALSQLCVDQMKAMPGPTSLKEIEAACGNVEQIPDCQSVNGTAIYHFDKKGTNQNPKRILAKALIHGDELRAGAAVRAWLLRLNKIDPRNTWRVIPVVNPDGWHKKTRTNANGIDLNRNFPTEDWSLHALPYWKKEMKSDPRRFPGNEGGSEIETKCLMKHFEEFKPDFIISIHTPLGVLDLDGPKVKNPPAFKPLPWTALGNFPGSLGRYMWLDRKVPVLTIELKASETSRQLEDFDRLQDIAGTVAIQANRLKETPTK